WTDGATVYFQDRLTGGNLRTLNLQTGSVSTSATSGDSQAPSLWSDGTFLYSALNRTILRGPLDNSPMTAFVQLDPVTTDPHEPMMAPYVTGDGRYLYVSDPGSAAQNHRRNVILKIDLQTQTTTIIAGRPFQTGAADGPGNLATFDQP